jgi:hypothetical protein
VIDNARELLEYQTEIAPTLSYEILQTIENRAHRTYINHLTLPDTMASDPALVEARDRLLAAALALRDAINANRQFVIYKTLVGFESVHPPAWDDASFGYSEAATYRANYVDILLGEVDEASAEAWFDILSRCAQTQSDDAATFPTFGEFLKRLGEVKPDIVIGYIERMEPPLARFLPSMLAGLAKGARADVTLQLIDQWLDGGRYLSDIAWYIRFADPFDELLLRRTLDSAVALGDAHAVRNSLVAAETQFKANPGSLVENVFLPAVRFLAERNDFSWVQMPWFSWMESPILLALEETQAAVVLDALVPYPELAYAAEDIAAAVAVRWPEKVIEFLGFRQTYADGDEVADGYRDLPYDVHDLRAPLASAQNVLVEAARCWFATKKSFYRVGGGQVLVG